MEAELTGWLCGFEPTGTPVALRIRTFADLRDEAARPHRRFEGLTARLPPFASLGTVVVGAGLFLLLAVAGAGTGGGPIGAAAGSLGSQLSGAGTVAQPPMDDGYAIGPDPVGILMLLLASALAGCTVLIPRLRRLIGRIAFGKAATAPSVPLPFRRS
jgi:hypothetical protein